MLSHIAGVAGVLAAVGQLGTPASAGYIAHVESIDGSDAINVLAGEAFGIRLRLEPTGSGAEIDAAVLRLMFDREGLATTSAWYEWATPFVTGGSDDFSVPGFLSATSIDGTAYADPLDPEAVDLYFSVV